LLRGLAEAGLIGDPRKIGPIRKKNRFDANYPKFTVEKG
jgi:hypothetical protein